MIKLDHRGAPSALHDMKNNLLRALNQTDQMLISPALERRAYAKGEVLYEPGDNVSHVYFPCDAALASFRVVMENGDHVETALIGREGAVGGIVSHGELPAFSRAVVQAGGPFLRIEAARLEALKRESVSLNHLFARYADCLLAQVFQATACNALHPIDQRTAKWILSAIDRTGDHEIALTQEQLAGLLGVGRSYVNRVLRSWRVDGIIGIGHGRLMIRDLPSLERLACDCNRTVNEHFETVLRGVYPAGSDTPPVPSAQSIPQGIDA